MFSIARFLEFLRNDFQCFFFSFFPDTCEFGQMKQMMMKFQCLIEDGNLEGLSTAMSELEALEDTQEEYMVQLETEQTLLLNKIKELGQEIFNSSPSLSRRSSGI